MCFSFASNNQFKFKKNEKYGFLIIINFATVSV